MRFHPRRPVQIAGLALALGLAACGGDSTAPRSDSISEADAESIGYAVMGSLYGSLYGMTDYEFSLFGPLFSVQGTALGVRGNPQLFSPTSCPSFEPDPFPDADGDGVPDNTVFSFDSATCDETTESGTTNYFGSVRVSDPGSNVGYDLEINGLGITFTPAGPGNSEGIRWDGFRALQGNSSAISLDEDFEFRYLVGPSTVLRLRTQWDVSFLADVAGSIEFGSVLPAGDLDVDGAVTAEGEGERFILVVNTLAPLVWDPVCDDFVDGTVRIFAQGRESEGAVQVNFNACGVAPTIVFVSNPV
jgi:hypothetical protein